MAARHGQAELIRSWGHHGQIQLMHGVEMNSTRLKSAKFKFTKAEKAGFLPSSDVFNAIMADMSDIDQKMEFCGGFLFAQNIASEVFSRLRKTCSVYAAHCQGIGKQSYGTTFEPVGMTQIVTCSRYALPIMLRRSAPTRGKYFSKQRK